MAQRLSGAPKREPARAAELLTEVKDGVATITLNRPETLNALSFGMLDGLTALLDQWQDDPRVRTLVLRGAGDKAFCAGGDVRALREAMLHGGRAHHDYFRVEYTLDYRIHT